MNKKFTKLIAAAIMLLLITPPLRVMGQEKGFTLVYTLDGTKAGTGSAYNSGHDVQQSNITWNITGNIEQTPWRIGGSKNNGASSNVDRPIYSKGTISDNISKIEITHGEGNITVNSMTLVVSTAQNGGGTVTSSISGTYNNDGTTTFTRPANTDWSGKYYKIVYNVVNNTTNNKYVLFSKAEFYKTTYTITYNANGATGGSVPSPTTHDAGSNATVAGNTGSLERTGFNFSGWNTQADGNGTDYAVGATISSIAQNYTLYAKWISATAPNIAVSGDGISDNALSLAYTASGAKTATVSYSNMLGYSNASVALYNDMACTEVFNGGWFTANLKDGDDTEIDYSASSNPGASRTVYMRVSASYNSTTYYSNVITVTQAALPCTVTYDKNDSGASGSMTDINSPYNYGSTVTVLANSFTAPNGKYFYKWNTASDGTGTYYVKDETFAIEGNITLYAIWNVTPIYSLVTSASQIVPGAHYVLASSITKDATANVMDSQHSSDYRYTKPAGIIKNDKDGDGVDDIYIQTPYLYEFVISGDATNKYTIYDEGKPGYLQKSNSNLNADETTVTDATKWTISISTTYEATIRSVADDDYYLQYNYNSGSTPRYKVYKNSMDNGYLYIKDSDIDCHIYSATNVSNNMTVTGDMNIHAGAVTVKNDAVLSVEGTLTNTTAANLIIEDGGQLITGNPVAATVQKTIDGYGDDNTVKTGWYTIASPVARELTEEDEMLQNTYDLYYYNEPDYKWHNYKKTAFNIAPLKGYLYANSEDLPLSFAGEMPATTEYKSIPLDYTEDNSMQVKGFNLVGNPFTCNLTGDIEIGDDDMTAYFIADTDNGQNLVSFLLKDRSIKPCEGFFVQATDENQTIAFNASNAPSRGHSKQIGYIRIVAGNEGFIDRAYVQIGGGNTLRKMTLNDNTAKVYVMNNDKDYAAATIEAAQGEMPVNFKAAENGSYTITINPENVEMNYLHLIDNMTGANVDLLQTPSYSFEAKTSDFESRFRLVFASNGASTGSASEETFAFISNGNIIVNGEGTLQVIDVTGRLLFTREVNSSLNTPHSSLTPGVYVMRLINGDNVRTQKIVIE